MAGHEGSSLAPCVNGCNLPAFEGGQTEPAMTIKLTFAFSVAAGALIGLVSLPAQETEVAPGVLQVGNISSAEIAESSGLIPSRRAKGVYWTHNDSGPDRMYGMTPDGTVVSQIELQGMGLNDCEDIAATPGRVYLADIGNNDRNRDEVYVYAVREPKPTASGELRPVKQWTLSYPNDPFDAESLLISRGSGYIIAKELTGGNVRVYRFPLSGKSRGQLQEQCELNVDAPAGGADLTADGRRLAVITREGAYLFLLKGRIPTSGTLEPALFVPFSHEQMEGCCFTRDGLLVTAESGDVYLFTDPLFRLGGARR